MVGALGTVEPLANGEPIGGQDGRRNSEECTTCGLRDGFGGTSHPNCSANGTVVGQYSSCVASDSTASMNSVTMSMTT